MHKECGRVGGGVVAEKKKIKGKGEEAAGEMTGNAGSGYPTTDELGESQRDSTGADR